MSMEQKNVRFAMAAGNCAFLLSEYELLASNAPGGEGNGSCWWRSPCDPPAVVGGTVPRPSIMEGSSWHKTAVEKGAVLRPKMRPGKVYLYQMFTTCFAEFETVDQAKMFCQYADQHIHGWNVDPVIIIDTNDPEAVKSWGNLMEGQLWR